MKMTYTDMYNQFLKGTQNTGLSDTNLENFFQIQLDARYNTALTTLQDYATQAQKTASTVASQQFYHNPVGIVQVETATVQVGSIHYPLEVIHSQLIWDRINEVLISTSAIPQFIFPRRDDFGIWPIPQAAYTITFNYDLRGKKLTNADYTTGTVDVTNNSATVTGTGTTFTSDMVDRWFQLTPNGSWYRIKSYTSATSVTLETSYEETTATGQNYRIGEAPEIPDEGHNLLVQGCLADYFSMYRSDITKSTWFNNVYWTGDGNNNDRTGDNLAGGLLAMKDRYSMRSNSRLVKRNIQTGTSDKLWGTVLTSQ